MAMSTPPSPALAAAVFERAGWVSLTAVTLDALMPALPTTILAVANGDIAQGLHVGLGDLQWITSAYLLGLTGSLVLAGKLGDLFGRRRIFLIGIAGFGLASLLQGMNLTSLIAAGICVLGAVVGLLVQPREVREDHADAFKVDHEPSPNSPTVARI